MGDVGRLQLDAAGEEVFGAEVGSVVGPLPTVLGPALFRVNGVLAAQNTTFEDARADLQDELATAGAVRAVEARAQDLDDQLAGGVTLEQLADETKMTLGALEWTVETSEGIAAYADFREAAATLSEGDFPQISQLDDGGIFAMRLDKSLEERPNPFDAAKADVTAAWTAEKLVAALTAKAEAISETLDGDASFEAAGLTAVIETDQSRSAYVEGTPAEFMTTVFDMAPGDVTVVPGDAAVVILRLEAITSAAEGPENAALVAGLAEQVDQTLAQDVLSIYTDSILATIPPQINQQALQAVHVNFP